MEDINKETDYWSGYLLECIGKGDFRSGVSLLIQHFCRDAYDRGYKQGINDSIKLRKVVADEQLRQAKKVG